MTNGKPTREDSMRTLRDEGVPDAAIARAFGLSRQRLGVLLGPSGRDKTIPPPRPGPAAEAAAEASALADLPAWLRAARKSRGLSQAGMAKLLGLSLTAYVAWEGGRVGCSLPVLLVRYLRLLDKSERDAK